MNLKQIIREEVARALLNEDNLEVKKAAKDLYLYLKKLGVRDVTLHAQITGPSIAWKDFGNKRGLQVKGNKTIGSGKPGNPKDPSNGSAMIMYGADPKAPEQIAIQVYLAGLEPAVLHVEKLFLQAYPNLVQSDRKAGPPPFASANPAAAKMYPFTLSFTVKEKTTRKGGMAGNTQTNKPAGQNIF